MCLYFIEMLYLLYIFHFNVIILYSILHIIILNWIYITNIKKEIKDNEL